MHYWHVKGGDDNCYLIQMAIDNRTVKINAAGFAQQHFHGSTRYKIERDIKQLHPRQGQVHQLFIPLIKLHTTVSHTTQKAIDYGALTPA